MVQLCSNVCTACNGGGYLHAASRMLHFDSFVLLMAPTGFPPSHHCHFVLSQSSIIMSFEIVSCFSLGFFFQKRRLLFHFGGAEPPSFYDCLSRLHSSFILLSPLAQKANSLPNQMCKPPTQNLREKDIPFNPGKPFQRLAAVRGFTSWWGVPNVTTAESRTASLGPNKVTDIEKQLYLLQITYNLIIKTTTMTINNMCQIPSPHTHSGRCTVIILHGT